MKKVLSVILAFTIVLSVTGACAIDLSGMSFDELVALKQEINIAIPKTDRWQEVTVPAGVWEIGKDIPAGYWTIKAADGVNITSVAYCDRLDDYGTGVGPGWQGWNGLLSIGENGERNQVDIDMVEEMYFINSKAVVFTPFTGKPDLGFN